MATLSFSPTGSISSHTLSAQSVQPPPSSANSAAAQALVAALAASPHDFLQPTSSLHNATLSLAKHILDPLASGVSDAQIKRQQEARKKRKRGEGDSESSPVLQLKKVHLDGFGIEQVWEQSKRVLDAARAEVERDLPEVLAETDGALTNGFSAQKGVKMVRFGEDGFEVSGSEEESELGEEGVDWQYDGNDLSGEEDGEGEEEDGEQFEEGFHTEEEDGSDMDDVDLDRDDYDDDDASEDDQPAEEYVPDPHGLNDGFFSIDDFNRQSEFLEQQDTRGDDDGAESDEEEVNWAEDPLNSASLVAKGLQKESGEDVGSEDEGDGPTFGNMDLDAPEGASDDEMDDESIAEGEMDGMDDVNNANNVMYADFFAPPAKKASKNKKGRPHPHNFPQKAASAPDDQDVENTMAAVHRDLFDESDDDEDASDLSDVDPDDPKARKSTHERRQAKLAEEIRRLEAQNVAKREWTLFGEARAADRPVNSLLEEDLDFERAGKPVPVITAEVSEDIESLIKRRIIAREFDEVIKRRPDDLATGPVRRGRFELEDTKAQRGLAEEYEEEHLRKTDPNYVDVKDEKLKKEHREIEALWRDVSAKLDALSSWHYKPKPAASNLEIRTDAAAITMEDARPTAGGDIGNASMLAPQEVYAPGEEKTKGEVVTKAGLPVAKEEMSREEKKSRRRRNKERMQKAGGPEKKESKQTKERKEVVSELKKGGVKVINKKGEVTDVEGKSVKSGRAQGGAGNFRL
ncbi:U3 snoRNP protein [Neofusicoccum ribis]|uniref:U3 small nucleolar ribonucleoprotein protein MPP10 n=1 Tax=Neofusicoccum ribis TaxID=45134 RepID=A0ABR3SRB3_9PEZI